MEEVPGRYLVQIFSINKKINNLIINIGLLKKKLKCFCKKIAVKNDCIDLTISLIFSSNI